MQRRHNIFNAIFYKIRPDTDTGHSMQVSLLGRPHDVNSLVSFDELFRIVPPSPK